VQPVSVVITPRERILLSFLRALAVAMTVVYVAWNLLWLATGQAPPSLMLTLTGFPAPTTGMTRSLLCLGRGDVAQSLLWNLMTVPVGGLFLVSLAMLAWQACRGQRVRLPRWNARLWGLLLVIAWILKFALGPAYW